MKNIVFILNRNVYPQHREQKKKTRFVITSHISSLIEPIRKRKEKQKKNIFQLLSSAIRTCGIQ